MHVENIIKKFVFLCLEYIINTLKTNKSLQILKNLKQCQNSCEQVDNQQI